MFLSQLICLAQFDPLPGSRGNKPELFCPVRTLRVYTTATSFIQISSFSVMVALIGPNSICPSGFSMSIPMHIGQVTILFPRCHSTRTVGILWAALRGMPPEDLCPKDLGTSPGASSFGSSGDHGWHCLYNTQTVHVRRGNIHCLKHHLWWSFRIHRTMVIFLPHLSFMSFFKCYFLFP